MEIIPGVRKKLRKRRTEKFLDTQNLASECHNFSVEGFVDQKLEFFFTRLGDLEAEGLYETVMDQVERSLLKKSLTWAKGNQLKAARVLGINRNTLRTKMRKLKVDL
ncbi:MAG: helix-turn-helix domain-containing protein [Pseudomonadota bacterium]